MWPGGFTADVTVANTGSSPVDGWKLAFTLPGGQGITSAWSAEVSFGFQGAYDGSFAKPAGFSLNGTSCTVT